MSDLVSSRLQQPALLTEDDPIPTSRQAVPFEHMLRDSIGREANMLYSSVPWVFLF